MRSDVSIKATPMPAFRPQLISGFVGLLWLSLGGCSGASAMPVQPAAGVVGSWARSVEACGRPEFVMQTSSAIIRTDADGTAVEFLYPEVAYEADAEGRIVVEFGKAHPYGKTKSKTALTFQVVSDDKISLVQGKRPIMLYRCIAASSKPR